MTRATSSSMTKYGVEKVDKIDDDEIHEASVEIGTTNLEIPEVLAVSGTFKKQMIRPSTQA